MYLYGASGHAKVIIDILEASQIKIDGLVDDNPYLNELCGYPIFHNRTDLSPVIVSIGVNKTRKKVVAQLSGYFGKAIHPSAIISDKATIGDGSVVMQGAIIQSFTTIGNHCIINTGASIDHECFVGDYVHISPHSTLCGNVIIGEGTWIGAGTTIIQGIKIGKWCVIGAGSVVSKDIPDNVLAVGNRCKIIKKISDI
ncbi:MAG: acetyltransferase [Alistipes sp.]